MKRQLDFRSFQYGVLVTCLLLAFSPVLLADENQPTPARGGPESAAAHKEGGIWIGLRCNPITEEMRAQLGVEPGLGLLIEHVTPHGPAAQAGLRSGDILVAVGERLSRNEQLAQALARTQAGVARVQILREGRVMGVEVKPVARPAEVQGAAHLELDPAPQVAGEKPQVRVLVQPKPAPPAALPKPAAPGAGEIKQLKVLVAPVPATLPEDMKVTVEKTGSAPATIVVEQGEKKWKATEKELGSLPEAARAYVGRLLGRPAGVAAGTLIQKGPDGAVKTFEFKLDEKGQAGPAILKEIPGATIKTKPGGDIEIEIRQPKDKDAEGAPQVKKPEPKKPDEKKPEPKKPEPKQPEPKKPEPKQPEGEARKNSDREIREIEEKIQTLRREIERLRKAVKE